MPRAGAVHATNAVGVTLGHEWLTITIDRTKHSVWWHHDVLHWRTMKDNQEGPPELKLPGVKMAETRGPVPGVIRYDPRRPSRGSL